MSDLRATEVAEGIHWIKDRFVNVFLVEMDENLMLIDSGMNKKAKSIMNYVSTELESRKIEKILLTHHHTDHTGGLHYLYQHLKPRIFVSEEDEIYVSGKEKRPVPRNKILYPLYFIIKPFMNPKPVTQLELIHDGELIDGFTTYHLPGHTMGSMGFLRDNVMFSGDAGITKKGKVRLGTSIFAESMDHAQSSLKKMATLEFDMILSGHGAPILEDASQRVKEAVESFD